MRVTLDMNQIEKIRIPRVGGSASVLHVEVSALDRLTQGDGRRPSESDGLWGWMFIGSLVEAEVNAAFKMQYLVSETPP